MNKSTRTATANDAAIGAATTKMYTFLKTKDEIIPEIYNYGDSPLGTNLISLYKAEFLFSNINNDTSTYPAITSVTTDLRDSINSIKNDNHKNCGTGSVPVLKCRQIKTACDILLGQINQISGIRRGGNKRKTSKDRRKQNKSRRNRKSRR
jgi:hypothetical protein